MVLNDNFVNASVLRVDLFTANAQYLLDRNVGDHGRSFFVDEKDEAEMIEFIKTAGHEMGFPVPRVYSTTHFEVSENDIHTKEDIVRFFQSCLQDNKVSNVEQNLRLK